MSTPELLPGHIVGGRFTVQSLLGRSPVSATYQALTLPNRLVAVRIFDASLERRGALAEQPRVRSTVGQLSPGGIVPVLEAGRDEATGALFVATELSDNPSLAQLVELCPLGLNEAAAMLRSLAPTIDGAHGHKLVHGALKPTNLFVGPPPACLVRIADFGVALTRAGLSPASLDMPTLSFLAPEQARAGDPVGPAADVFAAALLFFYALTGKPFFESCRSTPFDERAFQREVRGARPSPSAAAAALGVDVPKALDAPLLRALSVQPDKRHSTVAGLSVAIDAALGLRDAPPPSMPPPRERQPSLAGLGAGELPVTPQPIPLAPTFGSPQIILPSPTFGTPPIASPETNVGVSMGGEEPAASPPAKVQRRTLAAGVAGGAVGVAALGGLIFLLVGGDRGSKSRDRGREHQVSSSDVAATAPPASSSVTAAPPPPAPPAPPSAQASSPPPPPAQTVVAPPATATSPWLDVALGPNEGQVFVTCDPECENVLVRGNLVVDPRKAVRVAAGRLYVTGLKPGYQSGSQQVIVAPGERRAVELKLTKKSSPCGRFSYKCR